VRVFDYAGDFSQVTLAPDDWPVNDGVSPDGRTLAVVSPVRNPVADWLVARGVTWPFPRKPAERVRFIDVPTGREIGRLPARPLANRQEDGFAPDGRLYIASDGHNLHAWGVPPSRPLVWVFTTAGLTAPPLAWLARRRVRRLRDRN
jgi:hypothetical protein